MAEKDTSEPDKPGLLDRLRTRYPWFDHAMCTQERYRDSRGNFFAAGITYFTVFAMFPLMMVGFAVGGFVLSRRPEWLSAIEDKVKQAVPGEMGQQLIKVIDSAIDSRTSVGIIGLVVALWAGLSWMGNLREALTAMWGQPRGERNFVRTRLSDLVALISVFLAIVVTLGLTVLSTGGLMRKVLELFGLQDTPGVGLVLQIVSLVVSIGVSWLLFAYMIARLPRESLSFKSAARAGLLAAVGFELFKQVGTFYLRGVMHGPAGSTFGPVIGLLVFAYVTARLLLYATAWAATSAETVAAASVGPPAPAVIAPRDFGDEGAGFRTALAAGAVGALAALGLSRLRGKR